VRVPSPGLVIVPMPLGRRLGESLLSAITRTNDGRTPADWFTSLERQGLDPFGTLMDP